MKDSKPDIVEVSLSRCQKCGSTDRTPYNRTTTIERQIAGEHDGQPFSHVVWRRTSCRNCGQARQDKTFELRNAPAKSRNDGGKKKDDSAKSRNAGETKFPVHRQLSDENRDKQPRKKPRQAKPLN